mgnify:CR=1 FL=1
MKLCINLIWQLISYLMMEQQQSTPMTLVQMASMESATTQWSKTDHWRRHLMVFLKATEPHTWSHLIWERQRHRENIRIRHRIYRSNFVLTVTQAVNWCWIFTNKCLLPALWRENKLEIALEEVLRAMCSNKVRSWSKNFTIAVRTIQLDNKSNNDLTN